MINPSGSYGRLVSRLNDRYVHIASPETMRELGKVAHRPNLARRLNRLGYQPSATGVLRVFALAVVVEPNESLDVCRDPKDNKFFECAVAGNANYTSSLTCLAASAASLRPRGRALSDVPPAPAAATARAVVRRLARPPRTRGRSPRSSRAPARGPAARRALSPAAPRDTTPQPRAPGRATPRRPIALPPARHGRRRGRPPPPQRATTTLRAPV